MARAAARLRRVSPTVVAITGSFGKTSTKGYVAHLVAGTRSVVASPASFNNRAGLARAVNEHLADGTEVFVAEMGTYGRGEIAELCSWIRPDVAVITAIGPVHLERFGSEDRVLEAKAEILEDAAARCSWSTTSAWRRWPRRAHDAGTQVWRVSARDTERRRVRRRATRADPRCACAGPRSSRGLSARRPSGQRRGCRRGGPGARRSRR